jgi:hypothetical protein
VGGATIAIEYSRFNSGKTGSGFNDFINRNDSYKLGSINGNDYGRIDSTKMGSSNAAASTADNSGLNKNLNLSINRT